MQAATPQSGVSEDNDCNNYLASSTSPTAEEVAVMPSKGLCGGENLDGTDARTGDDMLTCGAWGADETLG